jgi:hypothetical protein
MPASPRALTSPLAIIGSSSISSTRMEGVYDGGGRKTNLTAIPSGRPISSRVGLTAGKNLA